MKEDAVSDCAMLFFARRFFGRFFGGTQMTKTKKLTTMAILTAMSVVFVAIIHFPLFPAVSFLEYDPADIPILICGFAFGPVAGVVVTLAAAVIQGLTVSAHSGIYGILMHIIASGSFVVTSSLIYKHHKTKKMAAISIACGVLAMVVFMFGANLVVTPYFMMGEISHGTVSYVMSLMPLILLFNLIKAGVNGIITFFIYKSVKHLFFHEHKKG